jgi:GxxExxY protein
VTHGHGPRRHEGTKGEKEESTAHAVIGAAIEVHRILGPGYAESVYEAALAVELTLRGVSYLRQHAFALDYKGQRVGEGRVDLYVADCLPVELKSVDTLAPIHQAQLLSYLKALRRPLGLLLNFKAATLREGIIRVVL